MGLFAAEANATTYAAGPKQGLIQSQQTKPHCLIEGEFLEESWAPSKLSSPKRVYWQFSIDSAKMVQDGICPVTKKLDLTIRGGSVVSSVGGEENFLYPVHIRRPRDRELMKLRVYQIRVKDPKTKFEEDQWLPISWLHGLETIQKSN